MNPHRAGLAAVALAVAAAAWLLAVVGRGDAIDFDLQWWTLRAILSGENPYRVVGPDSGRFPFPFPLYYPLPAAIVVAPLAALPLQLARAFFIVSSAAVLAWVASREDGLRLPMFLSGSFLHACMLGQWTPLLTASFMAPTLGVLALAKPQIGLAIAAGNASRRYLRAAALGGLALSFVAFALVPSWPLDWLSVLRDRPPGAQSAPILAFGGPLVLLALLYWRNAEARLLLALACVPQTGLLYDTLPLFLVCRTKRQGWMLAALSVVAFGVQTSLANVMMDGPTADPVLRFNAFRTAVSTWMVWLMYLPALLIVLWNGRWDSAENGHAVVTRPRPTAVTSAPCPASPSEPRARSGASR